MPRRTEHHLLLVGLFLAALSLRPQIVGVGPLLPLIRQGLGISHAVAGLLPTMVVLCMGLFAPLSMWLARRAGSRFSIAAALATIGVFGIARALVSSPALVIVLTLPVGVGVAIAGSLMPGAVKESWPERPAFATGVYATGISLGAALSAAVAVPLADVGWGWRGTLVVFSACTLLLIVVWLAVTARQQPHERPRAALPGIPWRKRTAWNLAAIFTLTSIVYYGVNAWLPSVYVERGWSHASAGALITVVSVVTLPVSILTAVVGDRFGSRRLFLSAAAVVLLGSTLGVILVPGGGWAWAALIGVWVGVSFPSAMTLPLDVSARPAEVAPVTAMMLGVGYTVSSLAPFLFGAVRDASGSFTAVLWLMVAATLLLIVASAFAPGRRRPLRADAVGWRTHEMPDPSSGD